MQKQCKGCGAAIQSSRPDDYGYVPEHLLGDEEVICQRCFRISHYGLDEIGPVLAQDSIKAIRAGLDWADGVLLVVDLIDFEAGLPQELIGLIREKPCLVAANKADLLPKQTPLPEVRRWVKERLDHMGFRAEVIVVSAAAGEGFPQLADWIQDLKGNLLIAGVTNVGKSRVIARLLQMRLGGGYRGSQKPTVSPYPGTTVECSSWELITGFRLADSPGYVPQGRLSDLLCPECARELIPDHRLSSSLYPIEKGHVLHIPGLAGIECVQVHGEGVLMGFSGSGVGWRKSSAKHLDKWLWEHERHCSVDSWEHKSITLQPNTDLMIHGLGWVSARKTTYDLRIHLPAGVRISLRPNLIGPKKFR
ncbi:MAG: hypothetical protein GX331_09540 [Firmicutes bacterium]|nr:hypothetical protein [Bacillota bacterium]